MLFENKAQIVKDSISMNQVLSQYGYKPNRANFICCPFHKEKTPSMKIYKSGFHCFGCGENGDVITFVQKLFNISFVDALKKIDIDFGLEMYGDKSFEELRKAHYLTRQHQAKIDREKADRDKADAEYWELFDEWKRLDENKGKYRPKSFEEEWHPLFVEALKNLKHQEYLLDMADTRRRNYE